MPRRKRDEPLSTAKTHLIDANVVLRYLLNDDPNLSARASALLERVERGKEVVEITEVVLMEVVWTLTTYYQVPRKETSEKLTAFVSLPGVRAPSRRICMRALRDFGDSAADFVDCLLAARSRTRGIPVYTFDETDFKKLACDWKCP